MATSNYPKRVRQESTNPDASVTAPTAPQVAPIAAPQVTGASGGAPTINTDRMTPPAYTPLASPSQAANSMRQAWGMTGTGSAYDRTFQRTQLGADPSMVAGTLNQFWQGAATGAPTVALPVPASMSLEDAQNYLGNLTKAIKTQLDAKLATIPADEANRSRFWRQYQAMPELMAALVARRQWTNQMVGTGPVADWLQWLKG